MAVLETRVDRSSAEYLANREHRMASGNADARHRRHAEPRLRGDFARETDHRFRRVDPRDVVAVLDEIPRGDAAAASELDDVAACNAVGAKSPHEFRRRASRELAEAGVVHVRQIGGIQDGVLSTECRSTRR